MGMPDRRDLRKELVKDLEQIEDNVALYKDGRDSAYQTVALQLRNMLLGGERGLLTRVLPDATFHPVRDKVEEETAPADPCVVRVTLLGHAEYQPSRGAKRASITLPIDDLMEPLPVGLWLTQWIVRPGITIRALIARTANEEVAHTEEKRAELLANLAGTGAMLISKEDLEAGRLDEARVDQETYQMAIVGIGEYVAQRVRELLAQA